MIIPIAIVLKNIGGPISIKYNLSNCDFLKIDKPLAYIPILL